MFRKIFFIVSLFSVLSSFSAADAQGYYPSDFSQSTPRTTQTRSKARKVDYRTEYMFAVSFSFVDSVFYMTEVQQMDDIPVAANYFIDDSSEYQRQFKSWLENGGAPLQIVSLYAFSSKSKADSKYKKVRTRIARKHKTTVVTVPEFNFTPVF